MRKYSLLSALLSSLALAIAPIASSPASATTIDFGASPARLIQNLPGGSGDFNGNEYASLGVRFEAIDGSLLNIGCATGVGDPENCLGADAVSPDDFDGSLIITFDLSGVPQNALSVGLDFANGSTSTLILDQFGNTLLSQASGDVQFADPGIFSITVTFIFDGIDTMTFGSLTTVVPEPSTGVLLSIGLVGLGPKRRRISTRPITDI